MRAAFRVLAVAAISLLGALGPLAAQPVAAPPQAAPAPAHRAFPPRRVALAAPAPVPDIPARPGARLAPGQPIPPAELEAFVDGVVRQAMADDHIAGVTVSVVQGGQTVLKKGYGYAGLSPLRPVDPDRTLFRVGSISKTFTWILVLRQVEAGRMRLDAPINLYLPEALRIPDEGFTQPVRVRDLMNHTPGFEDRALGSLFERDLRLERPLSVWLRQERPHRVRAPQALVSYSNYGAALAGAAVSEVTGKTYESLVESDITGPLGMGRTTFREPHPAKAGLTAPMAPGLAADLSDAYRWTPSGLRQRPFEFIGHGAPAGAASSTAADMSRYMLLFLGSGTVDGVSVYGPATAQAFATPLPRPAPGVPGWRHGLAEVTLPGGFTGVGHEGATLSFLSNLTVSSELGLGVFVATNTDTGGGLAATLPARIVEHFYAGPPAPPPGGSQALANHRGVFTGVYLTDRRAYHGLEGFIDRLGMAQRVTVTDDGKLIISGLNGMQRWSAVGDPLQGRFVDERGLAPLIFQIQDGQAVRFFAPWGGEAFERAGFFGQVGALIMLSAFTAIASIATLGGLAARARRDLRETDTQQRAGLIQTSQSILWLLAMILFAVWASGLGDLAAVMYNWPGIPLVLASTCALVAASMSLLNLVLLPFVWRGGRRVDSWTGGRKARFTATALTFLAYAVLLGLWGALEPWSG